MELPSAAAASASLLIVSKGCIGPTSQKVKHAQPQQEAIRIDSFADTEASGGEDSTDTLIALGGRRVGGARAAAWVESGTLGEEPGLRFRRHSEKGESEGAERVAVESEKTVYQPGAQVGRRVASATLPTQKPRSELKTRVLYGLLLGLFFAWIVVRGSGWFTGGVAIVATLSAKEFFGLLAAMAANQKWTPVPLRTTRLCRVFCTIMPIMAMFWGGSVHIFLVPSAVALVLSLYVEREAPSVRHVGCLFLGLLYCGYLPSFWVKIRVGLPVSNVADQSGDWSLGLVTCFISICSIVAADAGAYFGGKRFGKTQMTVLSPKKTWEGAAFGLISAVYATFLLTSWFHWPASNASALVFGLVVFGASVVGDLFESALKRSAGLKDSGNLIPGHGGALDRFDSYLFTGVIVYSLVASQVI